MLWLLFSQFTAPSFHLKKCLGWKDTEFNLGNSYSANLYFRIPSSKITIIYLIQFSLSLLNAKGNKVKTRLINFWLCKVDMYVGTSRKGNQISFKGWMDYIILKCFMKYAVLDKRSSFLLATLFECTVLFLFLSFLSIYNIIG